MDIDALLKDKSLKAAEKRDAVAREFASGTLTLDSMMPQNGFDEKAVGIILEAMEAVSRDNPELADNEWLEFAVKYIGADSNSLKREASRVAGNIAHLFPERLDAAVQKLLSNAADDGTVVRWGSAYALARIVAIPKYASGALFDTVSALCEGEQENGVKNQYLGGLKKARKYREHR